MTPRLKWRASRLIVALIAGPYLLFGLYLAYVSWFERPRIVLSSGSAGGIYKEAGDVLARVLNESGFIVEPKGSSGAVENAQRIQLGVAQLGFARDGLPDVGSKIRALARLYRSHLHIVVAKKLAIHNVSELFDARPRVRAYLGTLPSGTRVISEVVIKQYGHTPMDFTIVGDRWSLSEASQAMLDDRVDVAFFSVGLGSTALDALANDKDGRFSLVTLDRADALVTAFPYLQKTVIPSGSYASSREFPAVAITTVASYELLICSSDVSDRRAYQITEALFSHKSELMRTFPLLTQLSQVDPGRNFYYPLHLGAAAFYRRLAEPPVLSWKLAGV